MSSDVSIEHAAAALRRGELVGLPTETVYGLAGDATNPAAVARIFELKGRPSTNPLIVHVADAAVAQRFVDWNDRAQALADRFWPGPLTVVLPSLGVVAAAVTAGRRTVAVRVPAHPIALALLQSFDGGVAAPSANRSTHISPTTAAHVRSAFGEVELPIILDGGPCRVGIESTVLDLSGDVPTMLRPGDVGIDALSALIGDVLQFEGSVDPSTPAASPGQHHRHYAPRSRARAFERSALPGEDRSHAALLCIGSLPSGWRSEDFTHCFVLSVDPSTAATQLYAALRQLDATQPREIWIELPPAVPAWAAVRDRLLRATTSE